MMNQENWAKLHKLDSNEDVFCCVVFVPIYFVTHWIVKAKDENEAQEKANRRLNQMGISGAKFICRKCHFVDGVAELGSQKNPSTTQQDPQDELRFIDQW